MAKPDLAQIVAKLAKGKPKASQAALPLAEYKPPRPLADLLRDAVPPLTEFEQALERLGEPRKGVDPRIPWTGRGQMSAPEPLSKADIPTQERIKLNNALARAKAGKRLTLADRRLLGKHELARIMVRLRPKGGDYG